MFQALIRAVLWSSTPEENESARLRKWKRFLQRHQGKLAEFVDIVEKPALGVGQLAVVAKKDLPSNLKLLDLHVVQDCDPGSALPTDMTHPLSHRDFGVG
jgi:hypothetical protein